MKKSLLLFICLIATNQLFAAHFVQSVDISKKESSYQIKDINLTNVNLNDNGFYEFFSDINSLSSDESELKTTNTAEYISESGRVHGIAKIFAVYEARVRAVGDANLEFSSHEDMDVVCVVKKVGKLFTIDIYTAQDAHDFLALKK